MHYLIIHKLYRNWRKSASKHDIITSQDKRKYPCKTTVFQDCRTTIATWKDKKLSDTINIWVFFCRNTTLSTLVPVYCNHNDRVIYQYVVHPETKIIKFLHESLSCYYIQLGDTPDPPSTESIHQQSVLKMHYKFNMYPLYVLFNLQLISG